MTEDIFKSAIQEDLSLVFKEKSKNNSLSGIVSENINIVNLIEEKVSTTEDEFDEEIFEISKLESEEMLDNSQIIIEKIESENLQPEEITEFKRYIHTLKGCVRMSGLNKAGNISHKIETILEYIIENNIDIKLFKSYFEEELEKIKFLIQNPTKELNQIEIDWLDSTTIVETEKDEKIDVSEMPENFNSNEIKKEIFEQRKEIKQFIKIPYRIIENTINNASSIRLLRNSLEDSILNNKKSLFELKEASLKLYRMVKEVELQAETQIQSTMDIKEKIENDFDPLEFDRFTRLQELTRLINEVLSDIEGSIGALEENIKIQGNSVNEQSISTNNLLNDLMQIRLVSVDKFSERFYKVVRNTAKELNKKVNLQIIGEKLEIDKLLLDKIISPIEHILRNSIAHGIESPDVRTTLKKESTGKITLEIKVEGNLTIIKISDDGAGINLKKVREIGIKKNLIDSSLEYSKEEIINLIFHSGFSTAENVSQVAGRGVGMDVVKSEILSVGGTIEIQTEENIGTTFKLKLPVDVATSQTILGSVAGKLFAIPNLLIESIGSLKQEEAIDAYKNKKININGSKCDFYYGGHLLGLESFKKIPKVHTHNAFLLIKYADKKMAVGFDKIIGDSEIIVKPMGFIYGKFFGVLGGTILGDGRQALVINPIQILEHYKKNILTNFTSNDQNDEKIKILVVDDSLTVRKASSKILERNNFQVILATDGEDAIEQLQDTTPDIILSDIEMPKMDGFELVKHIRSIEKFNNIPITMITSRTAEKHQNLAFELGANAFLGKPYNEQELINTINQLIKNKNT